MSWAEQAAISLENEHVRLSPLQESDHDLLRAIALDPVIWHHFVFVIHDDDDYNNWFDRALAEGKLGRRVTYCITDKASDAVAGSMSFSNFAEADRRLEIGASWLGVSFQRKGVNHWAKFLMLRHAFEELGAERVEFKTDVLNLQARRALSKMGATEEGVLRSYNYMPGGRRRDAIFYSLLRSEWPAIRELLLAREE